MELRKLLKHKQGYSLTDLQAIVLVLVIVGVLFGAGLYVLAEFRDKIGAATTNNQTALGAVDNITTGLGDLAEWLPIIVVVIAAAIVIGIVIRSFSAKNVA